MQLIDSAEAARLLRVSRQTLYSYVSRGLLRAQRSPAGRTSLYLRRDVERLAQRASQGRKPKAAAQRSLDFGLPVMESALSLIAEGELWYRGRNAAELARTHTLEQVACMLWGAEPAAFDIEAESAPLDAAALVATPRPLETALARFAGLCVELDPLAPAASAEERHRRCARLLGLMAQAFLGAGASGQMHEACARAWRLDAEGATRLRAALVLCADHELNASAFTARCVASTDAPLHAAVLGALAALTGTRHGAAAEAVESLWDRLAHGDPRAVVAAYAERQRLPPGFGHRLYPLGDPRAKHILESLSLDAKTNAPGAKANALCEWVKASRGESPNLDFALVALRRALQLPPGSASVIFALGRTVGWLAHALEQQAQGTLIRPRAIYVGEPIRPAPQGSGPAKVRVVRMGRR